MAFRLNDKHKEIPQGEKRRGKRTVAKEKLYRTILEEIRRIHPRFNIGVSNGTKTLEVRWSTPYRHGVLGRPKWNTAQNSRNTANKKAPLNLHKSLTQNVRLRLEQSLRTPFPVTRILKRENLPGLFLGDFGFASAQSRSTAGMSLPQSLAKITASPCYFSADGPAVTTT